MPPEIGEKGPDFSLPESSEERIALYPLLAKGPVVLIFYPADWGWVCNSEMREFLEREKKFESIGVRLIAIGTNSTISHRGWKEMLCIDFPVLSDFDGAVTRLYDVLDISDGFNKGRSVRAVFVLDKGGIVRYKWVAETPWIEPDYDEVLERTKAMVAQEEKGKEPSVEPAGAIGAGAPSPSNQGSLLAW